MILSILTRHYKVYNNINFIPISNDISNKFSLFVGNNGVGKSSILESLNTFFNNGYWNRTKNEKQDDTFICPMFLIKKTKFIEKLNLKEDDINILNVISDFFFDLNNQSSKEQKSIFELKESLKHLREDYFFILCGITFKERGKIYFGSTFDNDLKQAITQKDANYKIDNILGFIKNYYSYIYIPVESKMNDVLKLETFEMQKLMNEDILEKIEGVLEDKKFKKTGKRGTISLVTYMNEELNSFMDNINSLIKIIDDKYSFKVEEGYKKNLTSSDLREKILKAYFSIRTLKKDQKEIFELSSGEQRIALIDIASAFLANNNGSLGEIILGIDEPEASLHISKCFNQFKRLESLTNKDYTQIILTTHWYGSIPTLQKGNLNHIEQKANKNVIKSFNLNNFLEDRRSFPDDIELKSFFELVSTILTTIKSNNSKWLIIEGSDDKIYLEHYLKDKIDNLIILPVGGCGNVIKIYEYLFAPFREKVEKQLLNDAKVLCIIDSDIKLNSTNLLDNKLAQSLKLVRLQINKNEANLCKLNKDGNYYYTTIEDCLDPSLFYQAVKNIIEENNNAEILAIFNDFQFNENAVNSKISEQQDSLLEPLSLDAYKNKQTLIDYISQNSFKIQLANEYVKLNEHEQKEVPPIFNKIIDFYE